MSLEEPISPAIHTLITHHSILSKLPQHLINSAKLVNVEQRQSVFIKGDTPVWLYYLISGNVSLNRCLENGTNCILQHIQQGFVSEASLFATVYHCHAIAQNNCQLLAFPIAAFRRAFDEPNFRDFWMQSLSSEVKRLRTQVERLSLKTASERILHYLETEGDYNRQLSHKSKKDWSAELGITHEALYRAIADLEHNQIITCDYDRIQLNRSPAPYK